MAARTYAVIRRILRGIGASPVLAIPLVFFLLVSVTGFVRNRAIHEPVAVFGSLAIALGIVVHLYMMGEE